MKKYFCMIAVLVLGFAACTKNESSTLADEPVAQAPVAYSRICSLPWQPLHWLPARKGPRRFRRHRYPPGRRQAAGSGCEERRHQDHEDAASREDQNPVILVLTACCSIPSGRKMAKSGPGDVLEECGAKRLSRRRTGGFCRQPQSSFAQNAFANNSKTMKKSALQGAGGGDSLLLEI